MCKWESLPRVICLPTDMKTWGKWGVTHGPTHASLWQLLLWWSCERMALQVKLDYLSQTLTVNIYCCLHHTRRGLTFPSHPFMLFHLMCYSQTLRTFRICCITKQSSQDWNLWRIRSAWNNRKRSSDYSEAAYNWLRYLSFDCSIPVDYKLGWASGFTMTPNPSWWCDRNKSPSFN